MTSTLFRAGERLVEESDHVELSRLVTEHAWRADHDRSDAIYELYVEDGELVLPPSAPLRGRDAIRAWGRQLVDAPPWRLIRHSCSNMRFVATGPDSAEGTTLLTVFMLPAKQTAETVPFVVGEDHDRFIRTNEGWRFVQRRWVELISRGDLLTLP